MTSAWIAIGEHRARRRSAFPRLITALRCFASRDLEALHPGRQGTLVVGLDDQMQVRALDTEVHDPEGLRAAQS